MRPRCPRQRCWPETKGQPGLTAVVKQLEESFGTRLLVRMRTGVSLTSTGEELLRFANESLSRLEEVEQRIKGLEADGVGSFVIGCHESLGAYFLPQWMTRFLEANPRIQLGILHTLNCVFAIYLIQQIEFAALLRLTDATRWIQIRKWFDG